MRRDALEREVLVALAECAPLHVLELARRLDEHPVSVDLVCSSLHDEGEIAPLGLGSYDVTDRGRRRLGTSLDDHEPPELRD